MSGRHALVVIVLLIASAGIFADAHRSPWSAIQPRTSEINLQPATTTPISAATDGHRLIGKWKDIGSHDKSASATIEFRDDGTFAVKENGAVEAYNDKFNMETGTACCSRYPASATTTGLWSIITQIENETIEVSPLKPAIPLTHFVGLVDLPNEPTFIKEDLGVGYPTYLAVTFPNSDELQITQIYPVLARWSYQRLRQ